MRGKYEELYTAFDTLCDMFRGGFVTADNKPTDEECVTLLDVFKEVDASGSWQLKQAVLFALPYVFRDCGLQALQAFVASGLFDLTIGFFDNIKREMRDGSAYTIYRFLTMPDASLACPIGDGGVVAQIDDLLKNLTNKDAAWQRAESATKLLGDILVSPPAAADRTVQVQWFRTLMSFTEYCKPGASTTHIGDVRMGAHRSILRILECTVDTPGASGIATEPDVAAELGVILQRNILSDNQYVQAAAAECWARFVFEEGEASVIKVLDQLESAPNTAAAIGLAGAVAHLVQIQSVCLAVGDTTWNRIVSLLLKQFEDRHGIPESEPLRSEARGNAAAVGAMSACFQAYVLAHKPTTVDASPAFAQLAKAMATVCLGSLVSGEDVIADQGNMMVRQLVKTTSHCRVVQDLVGPALARLYINRFRENGACCDTARRAFTATCQAFSYNATSKAFESTTTKGDGTDKIVPMAEGDALLGVLPVLKKTILELSSKNCVHVFDALAALCDRCDVDAEGDADVFAAEFLKLEQGDNVEPLWVVLFKSILGALLYDGEDYVEYIRHAAAGAMCSLLALVAASSRVGLAAKTSFARLIELKLVPILPLVPRRHYMEDKDVLSVRILVCMLLGMWVDLPAKSGADWGVSRQLIESYTAWPLAIFASNTLEGFYGSAVPALVWLLKCNPVHLVLNGNAHDIPPSTFLQLVDSYVRVRGLGRSCYTFDFGPVEDEPYAPAEQDAIVTAMLTLAWAGKQQTLSTESATSIVQVLKGALKGQCTPVTVGLSLKFTCCINLLCEMLSGVDGYELSKVAPVQVWETVLVFATLGARSEEAFDAIDDLAAQQDAWDGLWLQTLEANPTDGAAEYSGSYVPLDLPAADYDSGDVPFASPTVVIGVEHTLSVAKHVVRDFASLGEWVAQHVTPMAPKVHLEDEAREAGDDDIELNVYLKQALSEVQALGASHEDLAEHAGARVAACNALQTVTKRLDAFKRPEGLDGDTVHAAADVVNQVVDEIGKFLDALVEVCTFEDVSAGYSFGLERLESESVGGADFCMVQRQVGGVRYELHPLGLARACARCLVAYIECVALAEGVWEAKLMPSLYTQAVAIALGKKSASIESSALSRMNISILSVLGIETGRAVAAKGVDAIAFGELVCSLHADGATGELIACDAPYTFLAQVASKSIPVDEAQSVQVVENVCTLLSNYDDRRKPVAAQAADLMAQLVSDAALSAVGAQVCQLYIDAFGGETQSALSAAATSLTRLAGNCTMRLPQPSARPADFNCHFSADMRL